MEGEKGPESESRLPQTETPAKKTLAERLKGALTKKRLAAAGGLAGLATLAGIAGLKANQDGNQTETPVTPTPAERTIEPTTEPDQVVEITPTPVEASPTAQATPIPTAETPTPAPTQKPTPAPETPAPKPKNYTFEILPPEDPEHPAYETFTAEEARQIIESILQTYPPIDQLKIQIALGGGTSFDGIGGIIKIDRASPDINVDFLHELVHSWDWAILNKPELFSGNLQPELIVRRANILNDTTIGRAYPDFDRLFSGNYDEVLKKFQGGEKLSLEDLGVLSSWQADGDWIHDEGIVLNNFLADGEFDAKRQPITVPEGATPPPNLVKYDSLSEFLAGEKDFLDSLAQRNALWKINLEDIRSNTPKYETAINKLNAPNYYEAIRTIARLRTSERILGADAEISSILNQSDFELAKFALAEKMREVDGEKLAYLMSQYLYLADHQRLVEKSQLITNFIGSLGQIQH